MWFSFKFVLFLRYNHRGQQERYSQIRYMFPSIFRYCCSTFDECQILSSNISLSIASKLCLLWLSVAMRPFVVPEIYIITNGLVLLNIISMNSILTNVSVYGIESIVWSNKQTKNEISLKKNCLKRCLFLLNKYNLHVNKSKIRHQNKQWSSHSKFVCSVSSIHVSVWYFCYSYWKAATGIKGEKNRCFCMSEHGQATATENLQFAIVYSILFVLVNVECSSKYSKWNESSVDQ